MTEENKLTDEQIETLNNEIQLGLDDVEAGRVVDGETTTENLKGNLSKRGIIRLAEEAMKATKKEYDTILTKALPKNLKFPRTLKRIKQRQEWYIQYGIKVPKS